MALTPQLASRTDPLPAEEEGAHIDAPELRLFVMALFFIFGGITSLNDVIIPKLKELFTLNYMQAMLVQSAFFAAYFAISIPGALVVKRLGEQALERSSLDWTIIRPGGLTESETGLEQQTIHYSNTDQQQDGSIPRRLVARVCLDALETPLSHNRIIEITSRHPAEAGSESSNRETNNAVKLAAPSETSVRSLSNWLTES